jgi:hypothetical protein
MPEHGGDNAQRQRPGSPAVGRSRRGPAIAVDDEICAWAKNRPITVVPRTLLGGVLGTLHVET